MQSWIQPLAILTASVVFYWRTLKFKYVSDDIPTYRKTQKTKFKNKWDKVWQWFTGTIRWRPKRDHALTIAIHGLISVMIYFAFGANNLSFVAGLLFAVNPVNNQGSVWISGRGYTLPALGILIALTLPILSPVIFWGLSYMTIGLLSPLVVIGSHHWYIVVFVLIALLINRKRLKGAIKRKREVETVTEDKTFSPKKLILATKTVGFYFALAIIPFKITFYHSFLQSCAGNELMKKRAYSLCKFFWIGVALILGWFTYWFFFGWDLFTYGILWYFIAIAPFSNIQRLQQEISERYVYIANVGIMVALASFIHTYPLLIVAFFAMYATKLQAILKMYQDDYYLVEKAICEDEEAWYAWHIRGHKRWSAKSYREAMILWVRAMMISPKEFKILFNLAVVLRVIGNKKESQHYLQLARQNIIPGQEKNANHYFKEYWQGKHPLIL